MQQDLADNKIREYGFLLLLDSPEHMQFGIDNQFWETGPLFKGVKLIPPGAHFVYFSLKDEDYQNRMGFFIHIANHGLDKQEVVIRRWNQEEQLFEPISSSDDASYSEAVRNMDFDKYLGAYPIDNFQQWLSLSNYITKEVIDRLDSLNHYMLSEGKEREMRNQADKQDGKQQQQEKNEDEEEQENLEEIEKQVKEEELKQEKAAKRMYKYREAFTGGSYYTDIPTRKIVQGLSGQALTQANMDKSIILQEILARKEFQGDPVKLLGELQYTFISFLMGENMESFEHWKRLIHLFCNCGTALLDSTLSKTLFYRFIPVLYEQLRQLPKDFFSDDLSKVSFINNSLNAMFEYTSDERVSKAIRLRMDKLKDMLMSEYGFFPKLTIEQRLNQIQLGQADDNDDEMPVIVAENEQFISFD